MFAGGCVRIDGQREEVVESEHPERAGAFEQRVEHVGGGPGVGERAVARVDGCVEVAGQRPELVVRDLVADQASSDAERVDARVIEVWCSRTDAAPRRGSWCRSGGCGPRSPRSPMNSSSAGRISSIGGAGSTMASVIPVRTVMNGRDRLARVHQRVEDAEALTAAVLHRADLGDRAVVGGGAGRLEVEHDERDLGKRGREVGEPVVDP